MRTPEYKEVLYLHAEMHKIAGQAIKYVEEGDREKAEEMIMWEGTLNTAFL